MKRPRTGQRSAFNAHKRQKLEKASRPPASVPNRRRVKLDELQWNEVSMPDRLEDFEGFYGLEEIDDVHIVKDAATGQLTFETSKTEEQVELEKEEGKRKDEETLRKLQVAEDDGEESWEGFNDDEGPEDSPAQKEETKSTAKSAVISNGDIEDLMEAGEEEREPQEKSPKMKKKVNKKTPEDGSKSKEEKKKKDKAEKKPGDQKAVPNGAFAILADRTAEDDEVDEVDVSAWEDLGLSPETLSSLSKLKFARPTPIQSSAIPDIMDGRDVIGKASTGSGKTLAFGIPILESFLSSRLLKKHKIPLALIISPTRELAHQISAHLTALCAGGDFDAPFIATITGGLSVQKQRRQLENANIIIGTPGRLWEVISSGHGLLASIKQIRFLVVDEADRLLSEGHYKELGQILNLLDRDEEVEERAEPVHVTEVQRQTLVFSATFHKGLQQKLAGKAKGGDLMNKQESMEYLLKKLHFREEKPKFVDANPTSQMASRLKEGLIECAGTEKDLYLYSLLLHYPKKRALIFTNSVSAVRRLTPFLQNLDLPAIPLHSGMVQKARLRSVERFTQRPGSILVATDVAARGLDIPGVELVIHYHLPRAADMYVHRSGRTARAEASGSSILICAPEEVAGVRRLVAKVHARAEQAPKSKKAAYFIRTLDIDRRITSRLKPRATLAKKLADATIAKEKKHSEDDWMRAAAEELGVDYDSETFENEAKGKKGRGSGRKKKEKKAREMTKGELQGLRAELKGLLSQRINIGVSERYLTSGGVDVDALMKGEGNVEFLGDVGGLGFDDD
ncbi:DEAD-domain-containing protein [Lentithecium fluviatile CBS 122367]|uniref:ATP-dependent RNA helicase n=1 Tax=Lentithecium fluviatile CBS 122367 TaxID=1168545 RepID=A0A6G1IRM9_9PLEO|nr:DEAD-domain-containing protein [Lentithecium fluviatile CBS 122367]